MGIEDGHIGHGVICLAAVLVRYYHLLLAGMDTKRQRGERAQIPGKTGLGQARESVESSPWTPSALFSLPPISSSPGTRSPGGLALQFASLAVPDISVCCLVGCGTHDL